MRKISELLPIVRRHLMSDDSVNGDEYICYAVTTAYTRQELTFEEDQMLRHEVYARMDAQNPDNVPNVLLVYCLLELGVIQRLTPASRVDDPAYRVHRDKWLDDWQAELEGAGQ